MDFRNELVIHYLFDSEYLFHAGFRWQQDFEKILSR